MSRKGVLLWASIVHLLVDLVCIWVVTHQVSGNESWYLKFLAYNFCAFAMQMPFGIVADYMTSTQTIAARSKRRTQNVYLITAFIGCVFMILLLMNRTASWLTILTAGLGNALFHVGSGAEVLELYRGKTFASGVFVSTGALGLYIGKYLPFTLTVRIILGLILIVSLGILVWLITAPKSERQEDVQKKATKPARKVSKQRETFTFAQSFKSVIFLFLVVILRSLEGMILTFSWNTGILSLILVCMAAGGKCAGGFAADRFGSYRTSVVSLGLAAVLLLVSDCWFAGLLGVLTFNMTMPITLTELYKRLPEYPGFAFGLTTFALYLGLLPVYMDVTGNMASTTIYAWIAVLSLLFMVAALRENTKKIAAGKPFAGRGEDL